MLVKLIGTLTYEPVRKDFKKTNKTRTLIANIRPGNLTGYYNYFITKKYGPWMYINPPFYNYHVTIVGGREFIPNMSAWKRHEGEKITLWYDPESISESFGFWHVKVQCDKMVDLRRELGFTRDPEFHITVGRVNVGLKVKSSPSIDDLISIIPVVRGNEELKRDLVLLKKARPVIYHDDDEYFQEISRTVFSHIVDPNESSRTWERDLIKLITY